MHWIFWCFGIGVSELLRGLQNGRWRCCLRGKRGGLALRFTLPLLLSKGLRGCGRLWLFILGCDWIVALMWCSWDATLLSSLSHSPSNLTSRWTQILISRTLSLVQLISLRSYSILCVDSPEIDDDQLVFLVLGRFMGNPMFHSMIRQAQASSSEIIVLIDPNLVLLNDFTAAITKVRAAEKNWLLVVKPIRTSMFPFDLLGPSELWLRSDGVFADDDEVGLTPLAFPCF